jgi:serine protease
VANTPVLTGLSVTPVDPIIESGAAIQLTATGTFSDNSTADLTGQVTWSSTAPGVATVSVSGLVNATGVGSATITATDSSSLSASTNLGVQGFTIQGTISVEPGSTVDSDINDPNAPYAANDSPAQAQPLRNPAAAGGYVNQPGTGEDGRSFLAGDRSDFFRVSLLAGQSVAINLSGTDVSGGIDLDLFAYNDDGDIDLNNPDFASVGANSSESITVPSEGIYFIEVFATAGASNYALIIGQAVQSTQASLGMDQDFVPGEALVQFANEQPAPGRGDAMTIVAASGAGTRREGRPQRVDVTGMMRERGSSRSASAVDSTPNERLDALYRDNAVQYRKWETLHAIKFLCKRSDVLYAEPNYLRKPQAIPDDSFYGLQWHYPLVNLPQAWETTTGNPNAIVAVIDTGVVLGHPDLQGQLVAGYDFISSASNALDGDGIDPDPDDPGDQSNPDGSSSFHGTHVTGTVAAATDNNIGVAGVAWNARIMPLRALGTFGGSDYDVAQAIYFAAGLDNDANSLPAIAASVINMSISGSAFSNTMCNAVREARAAGSIIVAAAGNSSSSLPNYPAACDGAISVSAVDINKQLASYSNFGNLIDIAAPGGDSGTDANGDSYPDFVLSTAAIDSSSSIETLYSFQAGTSMASPHVAGVIALMEAAAAALGDDISPADFDILLARGDLTQDLGAPGRDDLYGYGMIDAANAVLAAQGSTPSDPLLSITPSSINFGASTSSSDLVVSNVGGGSFTVNTVTVTPVSAQNWLTVSAQTIDADGLGIYRASVGRSSVAEGTYTAAITFTTTAGALDVPVLMQRFTATSTDDAGFHYIEVLDPATLTSVASGTATASNGSYDYTVSDVPFGEYLIYAGSNFDNDADICDPGEACGAYLSLDQPTMLQIESDKTGIDFSTGFDLFLGAVNLPEKSTGLTISPVRDSSPKQVFTLQSR